MGRKREKYIFLDYMFHYGKEISKEKFYKDVIEDIDNYKIVKIGDNYYRFEYIEEDEEENIIEYDDFKIVYECENPSEDILKEIEKAEQRKK